MASTTRTSLAVSFRLMKVALVPSGKDWLCEDRARIVTHARSHGWSGMDEEGESASSLFDLLKQIPEIARLNHKSEEAGYKRRSDFGS